jgi:hypothetical protein
MKEGEEEKRFWLLSVRVCTIHMHVFQLFYYVRDLRQVHVRERVE